MGRAFEYRKAAKLKRWGHMAKTFTKIGKQIAIAVKAGGPEPDMNPALRAIIANAKRENMPKDNIERAIKNAMGKDQSDYKEVTYEGYGPHGIAISLMVTWALRVLCHSCSTTSAYSLSRRPTVWIWMR